MNDTYRILYLEDEPTDAALVRRELQVNNIQFDLLIIVSEREYVDALNNFFPDIILCDHTLPSFNSYEALKILKEKNLNIPFIVITATMTEDVAMTVVRDGADDYILKDRLRRLPHAVINALEKHRFENERKHFITEIYEKEASSNKLLAEISNRLLLATKAAHVGIWEYREQTREFLFDDVMFSLYGVSRKDFDGNFDSWMHFLHPEDVPNVNTLFLEEWKEVSEFAFEFRITRPDKARRYIEASAVVERDNRGNLVRIVGSNRDVTATKMAENAIQENIRERELLVQELTKSINDLKQFSYITSHNFRAPLSNLLGLLSFVDYSTLSASNSDILGMFKVSTQQLNKTINDLVKILVIKSNVNVDIADNNISSLLDGVCSTLSHDISETACEIKQDLQVKNIVFNTLYLESILLNLLSNAIKYRSPKHRLRINISTEQRSEGDTLLTIKR